MNAGRKRPSPAQAQQRRPGQQQTSPHRPGVSQPKSVAQPARHTPAAPPAYRPQPTPKVLQRKSPPAQPQPPGAAKGVPAAPPVYRPQASPKILQTKAHAATPAGVQRPARQNAGPVSRPQVAPTPSRLQPANQVQPKIAAPARPPEKVAGRQTFSAQAANTVGGRPAIQRTTPRLAPPRSNSASGTIQRTLTVHTVDVTSGNLRTAVDHHAGLLGPEKSALKLAINTSNTANRVATDVTTMAATIMGDNPAIGMMTLGVRQKISNVLQDILGDDGLTGYNLNAQKGRDEGAAFELLIEASTTKSRSKGTTNVLPLDNLPGWLKTEVTNAVNTAKTRNANLRNKRAAVKKALRKDKPQVLAQFASYGITDVIRSPHVNGSGWLPVVATAAVSTLATQVAAGQRDPTNDEAAQLAWYGYTTEANSPSAYIEFTVAGTHLGTDGWRVVFDYINKHYYVTLHYHWHKGYNPFFRLTGV